MDLTQFGNFRVFLDDTDTIHHLSSRRDQDSNVENSGTKCLAHLETVDVSELKASLVSSRSVVLDQVVVMDRWACAMHFNEDSTSYSEIGVPNGQCALENRKPGETWITDAEDQSCSRLAERHHATREFKDMALSRSWLKLQRISGATTISAKKRDMCQ
ncbi:hypothetical protein KCU93_g377, partial [Aureobasidium melanogenum]